MSPSEIQALIDKVKQQPNSLERNKVISHLQDARAWAITLRARLGTAPHPAEQCTCPQGAIDAKCPIHAG